MGKRILLISTHALAETYSTLTVLPVSPRISPLEAERLIQENILGVAEIVTLDGKDYAGVLKKLAQAYPGRGSVRRLTYSSSEQGTSRRAGYIQWSRFSAYATGLAVPVGPVVNRESVVLAAIELN